MKSMTFRYTTEVVTQLSGDSYEAIYAQFLAIRNGQQALPESALQTVLPMQGRRFFVGLEQHGLHEVCRLRGDFEQDVVANTPLLNPLARLPSDAMADWHFHAQ